MKKRLVIITYAFGLGNHPNAKRPYLMAKYLVRQGWDVTVLTMTGQMKGEVAEDLDGIHVECIPSFPFFIGEHLWAVPALRKKWLQLCKGVIFPDLFAPWIHKVAGRLRKIDYDCGILNVLPYSSFLLVQHGALDSRWVIDYQESVYPHLEDHPRTSPLQRFGTPRLLELEREALRSCGGVWFTSKANQDRYVADGAVESSKASHLPYFFDPELYPDVGLSESKNMMTILYGGHLDGSWRSPETFFKAWAAFRQKVPEASDAIRMALYGSMDEACWQMAEDLGLRDKIEVYQPVPYQDFLGEAKRADVLLYIDAREQGLFNPGKLADYFGAERPVLGFTVEGSEVEGMLKSTGMAPFSAFLNDANSGTECLGRLWNVFNQNNEHVELSTDQYSVSFICSQADLLLRKRII